ncbi:MAG: Kelch repeat-containing protein [Aureliella sp.]
MKQMVALAVAVAILIPAMPFQLAHSADKAPNENGSEEFADLPFEITSFGAARVGHHALVYGGHNGDAHSYSTEEQSNSLLALDLETSGAQWEKVAEGDRLQGLAMVPYKNSVVLIGGFTAMNEKGEDHDLRSRDRVRMFDIVTKNWTELPSLPAGRSSHDAAIWEDTIYVVGGWQMDGDNETTWHTSGLKLDLSSEKPSWEEIKTPPFKRRALAVVAHGGKIYSIGGMDPEKGPTTEVDVYDPATNEWTSGPALTGEGRMAGFGAAGWSVGGTLLVSTYEGDVLTLSDDGQSWTSNGKTEDSRFFHRLIPLGSEKVVSVGGANMESGKYLNLEVIAVD